MSSQAQQNDCDLLPQEPVLDQQPPQNPPTCQARERIKGLRSELLETQQEMSQLHIQLEELQTRFLSDTQLLLSQLRQLHSIETRDTSSDEPQGQ